MPKGKNVLRITVDERLDASLVRLLFAEPEGGTETIKLDDVRAWADEQSAYATPLNLLNLMGIARNGKLLAEAVSQVTGVKSGSPSAAQVWNGLTEGMVILAGRFDPVPLASTEPASIVWRRNGAKRVLRIDNLKAVKDGIKANYAAALSGQKVG